MDHAYAGHRYTPSPLSRYSTQYGNVHANEDIDPDYEERRLADFGAAHYDDVADSISAVGGYAHSQPHSVAAYNPYFAGAPAHPPPPPRSSVSWPQYAAPGHHHHDPHGMAPTYHDPYAYAQAPPARPPSNVSSNDHTLTHPISLYPASPASETPPAIFGIHAAHHIPSSRGHSSSPRGAADRLPSFPQWSATWYDGHLSANGHAYTSIRPPSGVSGWESETMTRSGKHSYDRQPGAGVPGYDDFVKEERIKMLERKFGKPKVKHRGEDDGDEGAEEAKEAEADPDANLSPGSVTSRGTLVLPWRKTLLTLKTSFVLFVLAALLCAILDLVVVKIPTSSDTPAIKSSWGSYVVHAASLICALGATWLFLFRPCCCDAGRKAAKMGDGGPGATPASGMGGMIIPVLAGAGPQQGKGGGFFGKKRKGQMMMGPQAPPTVNLIVDPTMLGGGRRKGDDRSDDDTDDGSSDEDDEWDALPGEFRRSSRQRRRRRRHSRGGGGFLARMRAERLHSLALGSLLHSLLWLTGFCIVVLAALCAALFMSGGKATSCSAGKAAGASTWCGIWACELAMLFLALFAGVGYACFGIVGYRCGKRMAGRIGREAALA